MDHPTLLSPTGRPDKRQRLSEKPENDADMQDHELETDRASIVSKVRLFSIVSEQN